MRDDQRERVLVLGADVDEMNVEPVDLGNEVRQGAQFRLALAPVVVSAPVLRLPWLGAVDVDDRLGEGLGASSGRLCPTPPSTSRCSYLPVKGTMTRYPADASRTAADPAAGDLGQFLFGVAEVGHHGPGVPDQGESGTGQFGSPLQGRDVLAHRRLGHVQRFRGGREGTGRRHRV